MHPGKISTPTKTGRRVRPAFRQMRVCLGHRKTHSSRLERRVVLDARLGGGFRFLKRLGSSAPDLMGVRAAQVFCDAGPEGGEDAPSEGRGVAHPAAGADWEAGHREAAEEGGHVQVSAPEARAQGQAGSRAAEIWRQQP